MPKPTNYYSDTDSYFKVERRIEYFTLGVDPARILSRVSEDYNEFERNRVLRAAGFDPHDNQNFIGDFTEPIVICGRLYPLDTLAAFEGRRQGCRFAVFTSYGTPTFLEGGEHPEPPETGRRVPTLI